jgi:putative membrane protein
MMMSMMGSGWGILNMIFWILIVGLVIYSVLTLIMKPFEKKDNSLSSFDKKEDSALQILRERFARGELTEEEFHHKIALLRNNNV